MNAERCATCRFFLPNAADLQRFGGVCRRFPPVPMSVDDGSDFPHVALGDWCGEFQLNTEVKTAEERTT